MEKINVLISSYNEIIKFPSRVQFYCQCCGKLTEKEFRRSTKPVLLCAVCNINDGKSKRTQEQKEESNKKRHKTIESKYGSFDNYIECVRSKAKETNLKVFGVENVFQLDAIREKSKKTKLEKYGDENFVNSQKAKATMTERYGAPTTLQSSVLLERVTETKKSRYGEHLELIVEKSKNTKKERYGDENYNNTEKNQKTCQERYGVRSPLQNKEIKERALESQKKTMFQKYGGYYWDTDEYKEKFKQIMLEKYGVENPMQSEDIRRKTFRHFIYDGEMFDSAWELVLWIYAKDHNEPIEHEPVSFEYDYAGKEHVYYPDFLYKGSLVEVKGDQFFKETGEMQNPFDHNLDGLFEAKHQCGLENGVQFFRETDMKPFFDYVIETYTKDYVKLFSTALPFPYVNEDLHDKSDFGIIQHFHKSIYEASRKGKPSPLDAWGDKDLIRKSALNRLKYVGSCRPSDVLQGFNVSKIAPKVSVFKPALAQNLVNKYLQDVDLIVDPFSGFSGRMIGVFRCGKKYIGWDINNKHVSESNEAISYLNCNDFCSVLIQDLITSGVNDWECQNAGLFTCPPYGDKEHWGCSNEVEKSCDEWIDICLKKHTGCKRYLFVVDNTDKYKDCVVESIENKSHFGKNREYVVLVEVDSRY